MEKSRKQASAPMTRPMGPEVFESRTDTAIYWLGSGGIFINCRGTLLMVDPVIGRDEKEPNLSEAGYRFLVPPPLEPAGVPKLDAILYTHADYDHLAPGSAQGLYSAGAGYHGTAFTAKKLDESGIEPFRIQIHGIGETFFVGSICITLTRASHSWQKDRPEFDWCYGPEDCCGFFLETPDGRIWIPGDSILLEEHLQMKNVDLMFLDLSSDPYHFGTEAALRLANALCPAELILYHYGTYDAPDKPAFHADPAWADGKLMRPERLHILAPGEPYLLQKMEK